MDNTDVGGSSIVCGGHYVRRSGRCRAFHLYAFLGPSDGVLTLQAPRRVDRHSEIQGRMKIWLMRFWEGWKEIAEDIGDFQSRLLLTVFYFTVAVPFALLARFVIDPLGLARTPVSSGWRKRQTGDQSLASVRKQF